MPALRCRAPDSSVRYCRDDGSRLNTLTSTLQGTTTTHTYTYLTKSELPASLTQKLGATTVLTTARTYDRLNRLVSIVNEQIKLTH